MGLMQVMPATYDELRQQYNLGDDPYDPANNIMAGAAYMREMYDIYGSPGFLAAYNAGPNRLDDYLSNNRPLPDETRRYVAMIGPEIVGIEPDRRSPAEQYAMNALPVVIPPGMRYGRSVQFASQYGGGGGRVPARARVQVAQLPEPPRPVPMQAPQQYALVVPPPPPPGPWLPPDRRGECRRADPVPALRAGAGDGELGSPGWCVRDVEAGASCGGQRARACAYRARGCASLCRWRARGARHAVASAADGAVA